MNADHIGGTSQRFCKRWMVAKFPPPHFTHLSDLPLPNIASFDRGNDEGLIVWADRKVFCRELPCARRGKRWGS